MAKNPLNRIPEDQKNGIIVLLVLALLLAIHIGAGLWRVNQKLKNPTEQYLRGVKVGLCWGTQDRVGDELPPKCRDCQKEVDLLNRDLLDKRP